MILAAVAIYFLISENTQSPKGDDRATKKTCTTYERGGVATEHCMDDYTGLSREAAEVQAKERGLIPQTVRIDNTSLPVLDVGGAVIYFHITSGFVGGGCLVSYNPGEGVCYQEDNPPQEVVSSEGLACTTFVKSKPETHHCISSYIGLTTKTATEQAMARTLQPSVMRIDGALQGLTDEAGQRIFFNVEDGVVVGGCLRSTNPQTGVCYRAD